MISNRKWKKQEGPKNFQILNHFTANQPRRVEKKLILIEEKSQEVMPLFCKQCKNRRLPIFQSDEKITLWLCEKCGNFANQDDEIIRELAKSERDEMDAKLEDFRKSTESLSGEKRERRKGVN